MNAEQAIVVHRHGTCDKCLHWKSRSRACQTYFGMVCDNPKVSGHVPWDDSSNMILHNRERDPEALNGCLPDVFYTGPKFGCVHHEPK